jgi:ribosomal subunit interface protein
MMNLALQITFHGVSPSPAVETKIRGRAAKLTKFCDSITSCRVAVEAPHRHHERGNHFKVRVELAVPGETLVASREPYEREAHADIFVAVRDAFDSVRRQLQAYRTRQRDDLTTAFATMRE